MKKIRWGLVSTARINRRLIPSIRTSARGELVAVASRRLDSAENYARTWDIPHAFGSYEDLFASDKIDAVYISVPNHLHVPLTLKALAAGKHVLCEKPFALTLEEVDAVSRAVKSSGCIVAEAFMHLFHPQTKILREWIQSGRFGQIVTLSGFFGLTLPDYDGKRNVRWNPAWGGGALWDVGVYPISFAQFILGAAPLHVSGMEQKSESGVDLSFNGQMQYAEGTVMQFGCSFGSAYESRAHIVGTKGRITIARPFHSMETVPDGAVFIDEAGNQDLIPIPPCDDLYLGEVEDMHAAILDGTPQHLSLAETRLHTQTVLALHRSAQTGRTVALSEVDI